ncbi:MAG TPA: TonB family protein [Chitinophagaceae bacterium]|nr:TonB family protein [Chitinophagaceae bacterium]
MRILSLLLFFTFPGAYGQQLKRFYDYKHSETAPERAAFYSVFDHKDSLWVENSYYLPDMKFYMYGRYIDSSCKMPVDSFYYFHRDGSLQQTGKYMDGQKEGLWLSYHSNGMMKDSITYVNGKPVNTSFAWHSNGYLADSTYWATDSGGNSVSWTSEALLDAVGHYNANKKRHGEWKFYHTNGKLSSVEVYELDSLKSIQSFDENGNVVPNDGIHTKVEIESEYPGDARGWLNFLNRNFRYPPEAVDKGIQGTVVVQFIVDKQGEISDVKAISGPEIGGLRQEAVRVISKSGKWIPAVSHGRKVKSYKRQPISFRLG